MYTYIGLHGQYRLFLSDFNETSVFSTDFRKIHFMKIRRVGADLFHADGWTDGDEETNSHFWQFCECA
jgi:hypothetical protein